MIPPTCHNLSSWTKLTFLLPHQDNIDAFFWVGGGLREEFQKTLVLFRWNSCHGHPRFQEFFSAFCLVSLLSDRKAPWTFSLRTGRADRISAANVSRSFCRTERVFHDQTAHPWRVGSVSSEIVLSLADLMRSVWKLPGPVDQLWQMESALGLTRAWQICLLLRVDWITDTPAILKSIVSKDVLWDTKVENSYGSGDQIWFGFKFFKTDESLYFLCLSLIIKQVKPS